MAERPVFLENNKTVMTEFTFYGGFAKAQKQRCVKSLHDAFRRRHPDVKLLEISSFSEQDLGVALSAFNLTISLKDGSRVPVELAYHAGKIFQNGGPYTDLLKSTPSLAKKDPRLRESGPVIGFTFEGEDFPTEPKTLFYNWLYLRALSEHPELADQLMEFSGFTDIVFNPNKSINCQARAAACYVTLRKAGTLEQALADKKLR